MEVLVRVLVGILIFALLGYLWFFLFSLLTGVVNAGAYALARGVRKVFGVDGQWDLGASVALVVATLAKSAASLVFFVSVFWYSFIYPSGTAVAEGSAAIAFGIVLAVWMPATFLVGLFIRNLDGLG